MSDDRWLLHGGHSLAKKRGLESIIDDISQAHFRRQSVQSFNTYRNLTTATIFDENGKRSLNGDTVTRFCQALSAKSETLSRITQTPTKEQVHKLFCQSAEAVGEEAKSLLSTYDEAMTRSKSSSKPSVERPVQSLQSFNSFSGGSRASAPQEDTETDPKPRSADDTVPEDWETEVSD